jgi:hypothetical protein
VICSINQSTRGAGGPNRLLVKTRFYRSLRTLLLILSTLAVLCNLIFTYEHVSTLICGIIWLLAMLSKSMLRFPAVNYIYLFIRFAGDQNRVWLINKTVIIAICAIIWTGICLTFCKKNR